MRTILLTGLGACLTLLAVPRLDAQTDADSVQAMAADRLRTLIASYGPARQIRWYRSGDPFEFTGFFDKPLKYASRFEIRITVTHQKTIWFRVYPQWYGEHINLDQVRDPNGLMQRLLQFSYHNFFFWGADDTGDIFAGYQFTLESGFPEEAMEVVFRSVPLIDESVGEMGAFIE